MQRREFLRTCSLIAAGLVAANQIDLLEKITGPKSLFTGMGLGYWGFDLYNAADDEFVTFSAQRGKQIKIPSGHWYNNDFTGLTQISPTSYGGFSQKLSDMSFLNVKPRVWS